MILVVTGTGTGVGKTVVSAALCAVALGAGRHVAYLKAAQTGVPGDESGVPGDEPDVSVVARLAGPGVTLREGARYPDPMSPEAAARASGLPEARLAEVVTAARELEATHNVIVLEGAGGLLVRYAADGWGLDAVAESLGAPLVVVAGTELGTLNALALTLEAIAHRSLALAGVVIGSWPTAPSPLDLSNLHDIGTIAGGPIAGGPVAGGPIAGGPIGGRLPAGAGSLDVASFADVAGAALGAALTGLVTT